VIKPLPICDECGKAVLVDGICPKCSGPLVEVEVTTDPPEPEDPPPDSPCPACERRLVERLVDPLAVFRTDVATRLGFEDAGRAPSRDLLAALDLRLKRIDDLGARRSALHQAIKQIADRLDAGDVVGAPQLAAEVLHA